MLLSGASGVASGYLYGRGWPGLNSIGLGLGLVATVVLDLALIPSYGALGAAVASSAAYLLGDAVLVFFVLRRSAAPHPRHAPAAVDRVASS
jgi:O-antigen/teichoic acid export membrane protein